jgi:hypothetical protein
VAAFADLARDIADDLHPDPEWRMEIVDELENRFSKLRFSSDSLQSDQLGRM